MQLVPANESSFSLVTTEKGNTQTVCVGVGGAVGRLVLEGRAERQARRTGARSRRRLEEIRGARRADGIRGGVASDSEFFANTANEMQR